MASGKRPPHFFGHGCDDDTNKREKEVIATIFEPMIRSAVREEVTAVLKRHLQPRTSGRGQKNYQLRFKESPGESYTGVKVKDKNMASLEVALYQCDEDRLVTEGPLSSATVKLHLLQGNFGSDGRNEWSSDDFHHSSLKKTRKGGELLTGDLSLTLVNGVATVKDIFIHDISIWAKTQQFRLGARVVETNPETKNIKEGISQPFRVKDCRGREFKKHVIPSLNDEIWRLKDIGKKGKRHKWLSSVGISTVGDFLSWLQTKPNQLKQGLEVRENVWKNLTRQVNQAARSQPYFPTAPLNSGPHNFVQVAEQGLPQHELSLVNPQDYLVMDEDPDYNFLGEVLHNSSGYEGGSCGVYMASRGSCITAWGQIRSVFKAPWKWLHAAKKKPKPVHYNY